MQVIGVLLAIILGVNSVPSVRIAGAKLQEKVSSPLHRHVSPRESRELRMLQLSDPLDCLSQVVCGMNTYPPEKPSVRTTTANDFAFLLKGAVTKLRSQKTPTTTTTLAPVKLRTTPKPSVSLEDDDEDDEYDDDTSENDLEYDEEDYNTRKGRFARHSVFKEKPKTKSKKTNKDGKSRRIGATKKKRNGNKFPKAPPPFGQRQLTPLDRLRMETNLRAKLLSDAQCANGLIDHSCPFNYQQMLVLMSTALERERTVSFTTNKILPMVGYLLKSRNYTGTLQASFMAIERINNYTIDADKEGKPVDFSHILDEVMNRETGDNGLRIVDTSNDSGSASVWEDDEFDHVLEHPYERKRVESDNYKLSKKKQIIIKHNKEVVDDQSTTSEEDTSEEGLVFDRPKPAPHEEAGAGDSSSEEDNINHNDSSGDMKANGNKKTVPNNGFDKPSLVPGPVFGFSHLQKSAEDE